jgi:transcription elongation factor GreA
MSARVLLTKQGYQKVSAALEECEKLRLIIIEKIDEARKHGDLSENAEYKAAREEQRINDKKISDLSQVKASADILTKDLVGDQSKVKIGARVVIEADDGAKKTFIIVSHHEADVSNGFISIETPIAKSMLAKELGDEVVIAGKTYYIGEISYNHL